MSSLVLARSAKRSKHSFRSTCSCSFFFFVASLSFLSFYFESSSESSVSSCPSVPASSFFSSSSSSFLKTLSNFPLNLLISSGPIPVFYIIVKQFFRLAGSTPFPKNFLRIAKSSGKPLTVRASMHALFSAYDSMVSISQMSY
jgi:hypothetical protein